VLPDLMKKGRVYMQRQRRTGKTNGRPPESYLGREKAGSLATGNVISEKLVDVLRIHVASWGLWSG
jgi:hypothetical protein